MAAMPCGMESVISAANMTTIAFAAASLTTATIMWAVNCVLGS
jgi:hypothetical protein